MTKKKKAPLQMVVGKKPAVDLEKLDQFAAKADYSHEFKEDAPKETPPKKTEKTKHQYPWEKPSVREDIDKAYVVPISEPDYMKLKYIAENTPFSMRKFCREVVSKAINKKIKEIL